VTAIVVDTSAVIAILRDEPERSQFIETILDASTVFISAVSLREAGMVLAGRTGDEAAWASLDALLSRLNLEIIAHDEALARAASRAFLRYGKGRHEARLNFGDCASYALAAENNLPLLYKGLDFAKTDITPAAGPA
jgi:ribonuclease VapC